MENQRSKRAQQILGPKSRSPRGAFGEKKGGGGGKRKRGLGHPAAGYIYSPTVRAG